MLSAGAMTVRDDALQPLLQVALFQSLGGGRPLDLGALFRPLVGDLPSICEPLQVLPLSFPNRRSMFYSPTVHYYSLHINVSYYSLAKMIFSEWQVRLNGEKFSQKAYS